MAYKFQRGNAILSGALEQEGNITIDGGKLTASAGFEGASLTIQGSAIVSNAKALGNVTTISGASRISGNDLRLGGGTTTIAADGVVTAAGAVRGSELSGTEGVKTAKLFIDNQEVISQARAVQNVTAISGAGAIEGNSLNIGGGTATITSDGAVAGSSVSGTVKLESAKLEIDGAVIVTQGRALQNVTSISGAGKIEGALLDLNGSTVITQARALQNVISISGAGTVQGAAATFASVSPSNLSQNRIAVVGASSKLVDHSNFTFENDVLAVPGVSASVNISASAFYGNGENLSGITAETIDVTSSTANTSYELVFVGDLGSDRSLGGYAGLTLNPDTGGNGANLDISGSKAGLQSAVLSFGDANNYIGREPAGSDELFAIYSDKAIDISGSGTGGILMFAGHGAQAGVTVQGAAGFAVSDENEDIVATISGVDGEISGSGNLQIAGTVRLDGVADTAVSQAADSIYFLDSDGLVKRDTIVDFVAAIAGAGLSAGSGKLSTQGSAVATQFNSNQALSEGYNVYTGSSNVTVQLEDRPAGGDLTAGDIFIIKQGAAGNVTISSSSPETTIDGESGSVLLESPFAAVSLLFVDYGRGGPKFRIV